MNEKEKTDASAEAPVQVGTNLVMKATASLQKEVEDDLGQPDEPIAGVLGEETKGDDPPEV